MDFGWKVKAERLRVVLLSAGHQIAKELSPALSQILGLFRRAAQTGDASGLMEGIEQVADDPTEKPLWEPAEIYGWKFQAMFYRQDGELWWLVHAERKDARTPSAKDIAFLNKVLTHLGAGDDPGRRAVIGPTSSPPGHPPLPFGWWTWQNREPLFEIQVNKHAKKDRDKMRIVPLGTRPSDGYESIDMKEKP